MLNKKPNRGLTLIEMLLFAALMTMVAGFTLRAIQDARIYRGNARDRNRMALIAQEELDRARALPAVELTEGVTELVRPDWPIGVAAQLEIHPREDGAWLIDVRVTRESIEGKPPVRLATIRKGGAS